MKEYFLFGLFFKKKNNIKTLRFNFPKERLYFRVTSLWSWKQPTDIFLGKFSEIIWYSYNYSRVKKDWIYGKIQLSIRLKNESWCITLHKWFVNSISTCSAWTCQYFTLSSHCFCTGANSYSRRAGWWRICHAAPSYLERWRLL